VASCAPHSGRFRAALEGVADRTAAESLVNREVWAEPIDDPSTVWVHDLIGSTVVDQHGVEHGRVVAVMDNPAHPIMELEDGTLVPCPFIVATADGRTVVSVPEGLFDGAD
jgi:16S rRNA processing protein RimM